MPCPTPMHMVASGAPGAAVAQLQRGGQRQPGAARAQRVAQRDRAAVRVDVLGVVGQAQRPGDGQGLRGERLVQLDDVQVGDASPARASSFRVAGTGPMPITSGAARRRPPRPSIRASGSRS